MHGTLALSDTVAKIRGHHRARRFAMKQQQKLDRALESYVRLNFTTWRPDAPEAEKKLANAKVTALIKSARKGEGDPLVVGMVAATDAARAPFDNIRDDNETIAAKLAATLPVLEVFRPRGFGEGSLAVVVGEAGDLSGYATHSKLWKRMGLAVLDGKRQGAPGLGASDETWIEHGYNPERRSMVWNMGESILKAQIRKVKDDAGEDTGERTVLGPYGQIYLDRKAYELARNPEIRPIVAHARAKRYMEKRLLKNLWRAWRQARSILPEKAVEGMPVAQSLVAAE